MLGKLKNIFRSQPKVNIPDFSFLAADMHSHLVPGIDDGVKSLEEALQVIRGFKELGYHKLITTPHIMSGGYDNTPESILGGLAPVKEAIAQHHLGIELEAAAEYYLDEQFEKLVKEGNLLTFGDKYVLFELSYMYKPNNVNSIVFDLIAAGYKPVLAHPERYPYYHSKDLDEYVSFADKGVLLQLNLTSLAGVYGESVKRIAEKLIEADLIDFAGSDVHNPRHIDNLRKCLNERYLERLMNSGRLKNQQLLNA